MIWEFLKIRGTLLWGAYNKDPTLYGSRSPIFGNSPFTSVTRVLWGVVGAFTGAPNYSDPRDNSELSGSETNPDLRLP